MVCNGPGGLLGSFLFFSFWSRSSSWFPASAFAVAHLLSSSVLFVALRVSCFFPFLVAVLPRALSVFSVVGVRGGFLFLVCSHLLKRVCSSPTGASQHAKLLPLLPSVGPSCCLSLVRFCWFWSWSRTRLRAFVFFVLRTCLLAFAFRILLVLGSFRLD